MNPNQDLLKKWEFPIKKPYTINRQILQTLERLRNHIAHDSQSSFNGYMKIIKDYYRVIPLSIPSPGEFLLTYKRNQPYLLLEYMNFMKNISFDLT